MEIVARPRRVRLFEGLMYAGYGIAIPTYFYFWPYNSPVTILVFLWWAFVLLLIWLAARRRRDWARKVLFLLYVLELFKFVILRNTLPPDMSLAWIAVMTLEAFAYYFVFTGDGRQWFQTANNN
jgi:hypothetical protein